MAMNQENIKIIIEAVDKSKPAFAELNRQLEALKGNAGSAGAGLRGMFAGVGGPIGAIVTAILSVSTALSGIALSTAKAGEQLNKLSQNTGISVDSLARFKKAAELGESSLDELVNALSKMQKQLGKEGALDGEFADALAAIGISAKQLQQLSPEDQLLTIASALSKYKDGTNKVAVATAIFGRNGAQVIAMLNQLPEAFDEATTSWTEETAQAADEFGDNMRRMEQSLSAIKTRIGNDVIPVLNDFLELLTGKKKELKFEWLSELSLKLAKATTRFEEARAAALEFIGLDKMAEGAHELAAQSKEREGELESELREARSPQTHEEKKLDARPIKDRSKGNQDAIAANQSALQERRSFLKQSEAIASEMMNTLQKINDLGYANLEMTEQEYYDNKARLERDALEQAIAYAEEEKAAIQKAWEERKKYYKAGKEIIDAERAVKKEVADIDTEIAKKSEQIYQKHIGQAEKNIEMTAALAAAKRSGELRVLESQIALQRVYLGLQQERGAITPLDAKGQELVAQERLAVARIAERQVALAGKPADSADAEVIRAEIEALTVSLEEYAAQLARVREEQEGTFGSGFAEGIKRFTVSAATAFQDGREIAESVAGAMSNAFGDFFDFMSEGFLNFRKLAYSVFKSISAELTKLLMNKAMRGLFGLFSTKLPTMSGDIDSGFADSFLGSLFKNGGIMTSAGPIRLNAYAAGGIANSPQLALFGEGRKPEAYVPLPDGRSIPVTMQGGGGQQGQEVTIVNVLDESLLHKALGSRSGKRIIMNYIREAQA